MSTYNSIMKRIQTAEALAAKIHAAAEELTVLIRQARKLGMNIHLENETGYSASNGYAIMAKITNNITYCPPSGEGEIK